MFRRRRSAYASVSTGIALATSAVLATTAVGCADTAGPPDGEQPNILMVLVDDLGYTDFGAYGGDAATPNIDALAGEGVQFTDHHAYPVCAPTRAALLTGQDPHRVGLGSMEGISPPGVPTSTPGYKGSLEGSYTGIAEVLSDAGYATYQVGKWHLGSEPGQTPEDLGFQHNFTMYQGAASHYADMSQLVGRPNSPDTVLYERDGQRVDSLPEDFYSTRAYTDEMIQLIDDSADSEQPFFGYLAYTAVHDPLHVPDEQLIDQYLDRYLDNNDYKRLRVDRINKLADRGLVDRDVATRWMAQTPEWDALTTEQQRDLAHRLAVYAAMTDDLDREVGRLLDHLRETGEYDNTLIVVTSDNGPAGASRLMYASFVPGGDQWQREHYPRIGDVDAYGLPGSFPSIWMPNAQVSAGPYFQLKGSLFEGGIRVPLIIKPPGGGTARTVDTVTHVADLYPTFADYAGADLVNPDVLMGDSAKPLLDGTSEEVGTDDYGMESFGMRAYRDGEWKLVYAPIASGGTGEYALYNLRSDPGETTDVADAHPDVSRRLAAEWDRYAAENGVVPVPFETVNAQAERFALMSAADWAD